MGALRNSQGWGAGRTIGCAVVTMAILLGGVTPAHAGLGNPACLASKLKEWGKLRKCQATETGKALQAKPANPPKCQTKFDLKLAAISAKATAGGIECRYGLNGDGTATDYDTGLVWEQKTNDGTVHDKDNLYTWTTTFGGTTPNGTAFTAFLGALNSGTKAGMSPLVPPIGCFAGHCDWRLPIPEELLAIEAGALPGCGLGTPCIDQTIFGPTLAARYWSVTTLAEVPEQAWVGDFFVGSWGDDAKSIPRPVRGVRSGL